MINSHRKLYSFLVLLITISSSSFCGEVSTGPSSKDSIVGATQNNSVTALGYYPDANNNVVGVSGSNGSRTNRNLVIGYTLPTLPVGTTVTGGSLKFEITAAGDQSNLNSSLAAYLLNTANPDATGTTFYYHGVSSNSASAKFIGATYIDVSGSFADDQYDIGFTLSGEALVLLQSLYGGDHIPDQPEAFFRFSLNTPPSGFNLDRYNIDLADDESSLVIQHTDPSQAPTVASAATATPNPVIATTTALTVLGDDDGGEGALTYTWAATGTPPAAVTFSLNGTNAAKNSTATFTKAGNYTLQVTIKDASNKTVTSNVAVTVNQTFTAATLSPASSSLAKNSFQQFVATAKDQFGDSLSAQPSFAWSIDAGVGSVNNAGLYSAGPTLGTSTVRATSGKQSAIAVVNVINFSPAASYAAISTTVNIAISGALTATDADGDALTFSIVSNGRKGSVTFTNAATGAFTYTPFLNQLGTDSFTFRVNDGAVNSNDATVTVTLNDVPPPTVTSQPVVTPNPAVAGDPLVGVAASDGGTITWSWGDGTTSVGNAVEHTYSVAGVYTVVITFSSSDSSFTQTSLTVFVGIKVNTTDGGGATPPNVSGILVNGSGGVEGTGKILCNYIQRDKTTYMGSISRMDLPASVTPSSLINENGKLTIGDSSEFVFVLQKNARGKSTGLPLVEFSIKKNRFRFKARRQDLTDLTEKLGAQQQFGNTNNPSIGLLVPVRLQLGDKVFLAMTFQFSYKQFGNTGKGVLSK